MRRLRVVETPEDLATLYSDAQGIVTYDPTSGRFYYPSLGLYLDPVTSMFYDPSTGAYRDYALRGEYSYCCMDDLYYDAVSGRYFDAARRMSFDSSTGLYQLDGRNFVWDSQFNMLYDPDRKTHYDRGLETDLSYDASLEMFYDKKAGQYYDPALGLYYDEGMGMFFDPICGRYYDRDAQMYYDPNTGRASLDADGAFYFDPMENAYYNEKDGCWYCHDDETGLYIDQTSSCDMGMMMMVMGYGPRYYDPETEFHFIYNGCNYVVEETGDLYDPGSQCYFDLYNWTSYRYDSETGGFVGAMSDMSYTPYWLESGCYAWKADDDDSAQGNVDLSTMTFCDWMGMYYDSSTLLYYDAVDGMYYDGMSYYRRPHGDSYWYDSMGECYVSNSTGERYVPSRSVDLSRMTYDSMMDLYRDDSTGLYYDAKIGLYTDFMCYYRQPHGDCYYFDSIQNAYVCYSSGDVYYPHGQIGAIGGAYDQLTEEQLAEIQATFMALDYLTELPSEVETMTETRTEMGAYTAAPFGFEDALWFKELMEQGMSYCEKRIRLRRGVMPNTLEVSWAYADQWTLPGYEDYNMSGMVVPVSEALWNRAERTVVFTLNAGWNSFYSMNALSIEHGGGGMGCYDAMGCYVMDAMGEDILANLSESDRAVYNRYAGDWEMLSFLANASYGGAWAISTMYGNVDLMSGGGATVGGLQDTDGDGLSDLDEIRHGTNPFVCDTDGDGMNDALEIRIGSCPTMCDPDSDCDGMADVWEEYFGFNPSNAVDANADPDHDGLNNQRECWLGTNPRSADTDGDGLRDGDEVDRGTQPCNPDTDNDQLPDGAEVARGTNPCNPDTDLDGLVDGREVGLGLDPLSVDTDEDGIADGDEVKYGLLGLSVAAKEDNETARRLRNWLPTEVHEYCADNLEQDYDYNGIPDWLEFFGGSEPYSDFDVFDGKCGIPAVFQLVVTLEEKLSKPICLDLNGAKVCLKEPCTITHWCCEGEEYNLTVIGQQGVKVKASYEIKSPNGMELAVDDGLGSMFKKILSFPVDLFSGQWSKLSGGFAQPKVVIDPEIVCFHGTGVNQQTNKTLTCAIVPEKYTNQGSALWYINGIHDGNGDVFIVEGNMVNVTRKHDGETVHCRFKFVDGKGTCHFVEDERYIGSCIREDQSAEQEDWCKIHDRAQRICREVLKIENCSMCGDSSKTEFLKAKSDGGTGRGDPGNCDPENENGEPYFRGSKAAYSVALNNDDDNHNKKFDYRDEVVDGEDDLKIVKPIIPGGADCCRCPEHASLWYVVPQDRRRLQVYPKSGKTFDSYYGFYSADAEAYVEGIERSENPEDAWIDWYMEENRDPNHHVSKFTVYSLRLTPDLNGDNSIDAEDMALVPDMKTSGLGWCIAAEKPSLLKLNIDVELPGDVYMELTCDGDGEINFVNSVSTTGWTYLSVKKGAPVVQMLNKKYIPIAGERYLWVTASKSGMTGTIEIVYKGTGAAAGYECHSKLKITVPVLQMAGDGGVRDGEVKFDDPADTNVLFWVNNDYDVIKFNENDYQEDDNPELCKVNGTAICNCDDDYIGMASGSRNVNYVVDVLKRKRHYCFRDLEDFDRLHLKMDENLLKGKKLVHEFRFVPAEGDTCPSINLFNAVASDDFYLRGVTEGEYNSEPETGSPLQVKLSNLELQMQAKRIVMVTNKWQEIKTGQYKMEKFNKFLYEGRRKGTGFLEMRVRCGKMIVASNSLKMQLVDARSFTDVYRIPDTPITDAIDGDEFALQVEPVESPCLSTVKVPGRDDKELALLVLGWNVCGDEKYAWNDMVFKRLFWHGYRGRAGSLVWPCQSGIRGGWAGDYDAAKDPQNFDRSEHRAWLSGVVAAELFRKLVADGTHLTLITHSQGNVVVGEALRRLTDKERGNITYLAWQGAFSAQMYSANYDVTIKGSKHNLHGSHITEIARTCGGVASWIDSFDGDLGVDVYGHYPHGKPVEKPYMNEVTSSLRYSRNFYNRKDYALDKWIFNHSTRPDRLENLPFGYTENEIKCQIPQRNGSAIEVTLADGVGRFYQNRANGCKMVIYPGESTTKKGNEYELVYKDSRGLPFEGGEIAKWCVFSFVAKSRSLAIGQVDMGGVFKGNTNLVPSDKTEQLYGYTRRHYGHSYQFRSNIGFTWKMWDDIVQSIKVGK